jgi:hypothetical protein
MATDDSGSRTPSSGQPVVGFAADIQPLFRETDRDSMSSYFDLWSYEDVSDNVDAILERLEEGSMPCDGPWSPQQIDLLDRWREGGRLP